jgi:hypothetical protein
MKHEQAASVAHSASHAATPSPPEWLLRNHLMLGTTQQEAPAKRVHGERQEIDGKVVNVPIRERDDS